MLILDKNVRNVRFVLFTKTSFAGRFRFQIIGLKSIFNTATSETFSFTLRL